MNGSCQGNEFYQPCYSVYDVQTSMNDAIISDIQSYSEEQVKERCFFFFNILLFCFFISLLLTNQSGSFLQHCHKCLVGRYLIIWSPLAGIEAKKYFSLEATHLAKNWGLCLVRKILPGYLEQFLLCRT